MYCVGQVLARIQPDSSSIKASDAKACLRAYFRTGVDPKKLRRAIGLSRCRLISLQESVLEYLESVCEQLRQQGHFVEVTTVGSNEMKDIIREIAEEAHNKNTDISADLCRYSTAIQ